MRRLIAAALVGIGVIALYIFAASPGLALLPAGVIGAFLAYLGLILFGVRPSRRVTIFVIAIFAAYSGVKFAIPL